MTRISSEDGREDSVVTGMPPSEPYGNAVVERLVRMAWENPPRRGRTTEAVTELLREAILSNVLPASFWVREDEIAEALGISRTPVREALRRLADEGMVVKTANHGTMIVPMTFEDMLSLYVVRESLEGAAARLAAQDTLGGAAHDLQEANEGLKDAVARHDVSLMVEANLEFHRRLRGAAGNPYLTRFMLQLEHAVRRLNTSTFEQPERRRQVIDEHQAIIDAIRSADGQAAEDAARAHMRNARGVRLNQILGSRTDEK